ncbi:hypothetical protein F4820DRAFT_419243 [Hypoxylon rubiginosum]|uniref:Uncharacterized protein n=1 Tax=Hypoxylon rubiginosum TaxID=110542 RepID=A0ACB9Z370_9PEZI|nr:hypothetical protein F4820DRAFT_419243 [Hypoxylon rubiginosum]
MITAVWSVLAGLLQVVAPSGDPQTWLAGDRGAIYTSILCTYLTYNPQNRPCPRMCCYQRSHAHLAQCSKLA